MSLILTTMKTLIKENSSAHIAAKIVKINSLASNSILSEIRAILDYLELNGSLLEEYVNNAMSLFSPKRYPLVEVRLPSPIGGEPHPR